ncbi:MAG: hypothetical protein HRU07_04515 [Nitrosopumilus sp.]|nr:hypothetical protein [Nitrosopumilus sp.]NRA05416.1 hypothetical protein [Nitrosopumilus sp.]
MSCIKFIQKCYGIRSEIIHGKKRKTKILENERKLSDEEIKEKLEEYVRKGISKILRLHMMYESQENVLAQIDNYTLNRGENLYDD